MRIYLLALGLWGLAWASPAQRIVAARKHLGDQYSAAYVSGGYPPAGQSACVDVLVTAWKAERIDLRQALQKDRDCGLYPWLRDIDIDHRWAPNLKVWFSRHTQKLALGRDFQAGDVVFWSLTGDGVADHCGVLSDKRGATGKWLVIHQFPPRCVEEDCLGRWPVVGHYRP